MERPRMLTSYFNSRPCARGDFRQASPKVRKFHFNSRPCARGDEMAYSSTNGDCNISIPAPAQGATNELIKALESMLFQFPPLRKGRLPKTPKRKQRILISIPAPAQGATVVAETLPAGRKYFNSRPCARGDAAARAALWMLPDFNSRPCARGDFDTAVDAESAYLFQFPPLRKGRPAAPASSSFTLFTFQFPPLRKGRPRRAARCMWPSNFNSRPCARGDHLHGHQHRHP